MVRKLIHSYDDRVFKVDLFASKNPKTIGVIVLFNFEKRDTSNEKKNVIRSVCEFFQTLDFNLMCVNFSNLNGQTKENPFQQENNSYMHTIANSVHDCYICVEEFQKTFPEMQSIIIVGFFSAGMVALQLAMRILLLEKFILIMPEFTNSDYQYFSSCVSQGLIIYSNPLVQEKDTAAINEIANFLRVQKKVYVDTAYINNFHTYFDRNKIIMNKVLYTYFKNTFIDLPDIEFNIPNELSGENIENVNSPELLL